MGPASVCRDVGSNVVYAQDVHALMAEVQGRANREEITIVIAGCDAMHERFSRVSYEATQPEVLETAHVAQQFQRLQRIFAEADTRIENNSGEIEPCLLPLCEPLRQPLLDEHTGIAVERQTGTPGLNGLGTTLQASLETSNVNVVEELVNMIETQRAYEMNSKAVEATDSMLKFIVNNT